MTPLRIRALKTAKVLAIIVATIVLIRAFDARKLPELQVWHEVHFENEFDANQDSVDSLASYLELEQALFDELNEKVYGNEIAGEGFVVSRFKSDSAFNAQNHPTNWNRTVELIPQGKPRAVALMLHGLTDSPYSMRATAELFLQRGYRVLVPRLPGHGTAPGGLKQVHWEDWHAVVQLAARHLQSVASDDAPFVIVGYSNGGALAVNYAFDAVEDNSLLQPDRLILMSPAIGLTPFAFFASWNRSLSWLPFFRKFAWDSVLPEYDPFKYNSFPKAAGNETYELAGQVRKRLSQLKEAGRVEEFPKLITFASLVDSTVLTSATADYLYGELNRALDELVLYDINRATEVQQFLISEHLTLLQRLWNDESRNYRLTLISNRAPDDSYISAITSFNGRASNQVVNGEWPPETYSLSHVAIPFRPDDKWYGSDPSPSIGHVNIAKLNPRGEKNLLAISSDQLLRLRYNPFYNYQAARIDALLDEFAQTTDDQVPL